MRILRMFQAFFVACALAVPALSVLPFPFAVAAEDTFSLVRGEHGWPLRWEKEPGKKAAVIRYALVERDTAFPDGMTSRSRNCTRMTAITRVFDGSGITEDAFAERTAAAFARWSAVANVRFRRVAQKDADVLIGAQKAGVGIAYANIREAPSENIGNTFGVIAKGAICLNPNLAWLATRGGSETRPSIEYVLTHEIGHILGLDHFGGEERALMGFPYTGDPTLRAGDVQTVRFLYGPPLHTSNPPDSH